MKLYLLLTLCFAATVLADANDNKVLQCAWGESYWCSSLPSAVTCGAFDHCKTTVWKNQLLKEDSSEICQFCESIVGDVTKFITDNQTEAEILNLLTMACGIIPDPTIATDCKSVVSLYVPNIIDMIRTKLSPQVICSLIGICSGLQDKVKHAPLSAPVPVNPASTAVVLRKIPQRLNVESEPLCADCKKLVQDIQNIITANTTEAQIEQMIDSEVCAMLGSEQDICKSLVHEFLPELLDMMKSYIDPNLICQAFGACTSDLAHVKNYLINYRLKKLPLYRAMKESSPATCIVCKSIMSELQVLDREKTVQTEFISLVKSKLCVRLGSLKVECEITVDMYAPELFELLATELDPTTRCQSLGFCAAEQESHDVVRQHTPAVKPAPAANDAECVICEWVMQQIDKMITTNASEAQILAALDHVCSLFPKTVADDCKNFVDTYGPAIIQILVSETDPATVCTMLQLCKASKAPGLLPPPIKLSTPETCVICETVVQYLEALVEQNASIAEIEAILDKICNFLPETMKEQCDDFVKTYGALIIQYITTMKSPQEICTLVHACDAAKSKSPMRMADLKPAKPVQEIVEPPAIAKKQPMLGQNKCTWGPSYWCANADNAAECKAVDHCKQYVWKK